MGEVRVILYVAQAASIVAAVWMLARLASAGLIKRFPFFSAYTLVSIGLLANSLIAALLISSSGAKEAQVALMRRQFYVWLALTVVQAVLALIVVLELNNRFLDPYPALQRMADRTLQIGMLTVSIGLLVGVWLGPDQLIRSMRGFSHLGGVLVAAALLALCLLVAVFTRHFRIEAAPNFKAILIGVGGLFGAMVVWEGVAGISRNIPAVPLGIAQSAILTGVFVWTGRRIASQGNRALAAVSGSPNAALRRLEALNEMMSRSYR